MAPLRINEQEVTRMGKNQQVTPHPDGGWQVKGEGNEKSTVRTGNILPEE